MANSNPEVVNSEEPDPNRLIPKKKSGFQITSVTYSGHDRPSSITRDGEESADDLDESHASYSDVSYSRTTDADHDQESTASEDTLNISIHDSTTPHSVIKAQGSKVDLPPDTNVKVATSQRASPLDTNTTFFSSNTTSIASTQSSTAKASTAFVETALQRSIQATATTSVVTVTATTKSTAVSTVKAPGTRVYKVVKRDPTQPAKRARGKWNWYDFTDAQAPMTGIPYSVEKTRMEISDPFHSFNSSHQQVMGLAVDAFKTAMGDAATGDTNDAARTHKIDNKIEAAMDLVKTHLMSAVRDEVDELKEKIKDLTEESTRLKNENEDLRAALSSEVASQVDSSLSPPKE